LLRESDPRNPVSFYGRSKADCELAAVEFSDRFPVSIVRPPIVLGGGDRHGLQMFDLIDRWGWHVVPGFADRLFSLIHVDDLANVLINVGDRGRRLSRESASQGIYFGSGDETLTYADLGRLIGKALGRTQTRIIRIARPLMWAFAAINEIKGRLISQAQFLNMDKYREAFAGSWACSNEKLKEEIGGAPFPPLLLRLRQTVDWYRQRGWLRALPQIELTQPSSHDVIHQ
jgi:nucleoside-diphosphate-sugar epimerase